MQRNKNISQEVSNASQVTSTGQHTPAGGPRTEGASFRGRGNRNSYRRNRNSTTGRQQDSGKPQDQTQGGSKQRSRPRSNKSRKNPNNLHERMNKLEEEIKSSRAKNPNQAVSFANPNVNPSQSKQGAPNLHHAPGQKICNYCRQGGFLKEDCRFLIKQGIMPQIQKQPDRKLIQKNQVKVADEESKDQFKVARIRSNPDQPLQFKKSKNNQPVSEDLNQKISGGFKKNSVDRLTEDHILVQHHLNKMLVNSDHQSEVDNLIECYDQKLSKDMKLEYRETLVNSDFDTQATIQQFEDLNDRPAGDLLSTEDSKEKFFDLPDGSKISVKLHKAPRLTQHLFVILKAQAGNCHVWFDENMEFSLRVLDKYKDLCYQQPLTWSKDYDAAVQAQMESYIKEGIVKELDEGEKYYGVTPLNVVGAPGKKLRITMDARMVNEFFAPPTIYLPNVLHPLSIQGEKWYTKIDLSEAFNHVRFTKEFSKWFSFQYKGKTYVWRHMGFGWNLAPAIFQTIMEAVLKHCRQQYGLVAYSYYDDILIVDHDQTKLEQKTFKLLQELLHCGFQVNSQKSITKPQMEIEFLGFLLGQQEARVSDQTIEKFQEMVDQWKNDKIYLHLLRLLGVASWCSIVGRDIQYLTTSLHQAIPSKIRANKRLHTQKCSDEVIKIATTTIQDLLDLFNDGISLSPKIQEKTFVVFVDASPNGFLGFKCGTSIQQLPLHSREATRDIDTLETLAVAKALRLAPKNSNIIVKSDSNVAMFSFMRGTSSNPEIRKIIADTSKLTREKNISFIIQRVQSGKNEADRPSRVKLQDSEKTQWVNFWQQSKDQMTFDQYMKWIKQIREDQPYRTNARALLSMLLSKKLKIHAVATLGHQILEENQLFEGDAAKVLKQAVLNYLTFHPVKEQDLKKNSAIISRIILRLGQVGVISWKEVQQASEGKLSRKMIDENFFAKRQDKFQVDKELIDITKAMYYIYDGDIESEAMNSHLSDRNKRANKKVEQLHNQVDDIVMNKEHSDEDDGDPHSKRGAQGPRGGNSNSLGNLSKKQISGANMGIHQAWQRSEQDYQDSIAALELELARAKEESAIQDRATEIRDEIQANLDQVNQSNSLFASRIEELEATIQKRDTKVQELQEEITLSKKEVTALNEQLVSNVKKRDLALQKDLDKAREENSKAAKELLKSKEQNQQLMEQVKDGVLKQKQTFDNNTALTEELSQSKQKVTKLEAENGIKQTKMATLQIELETSKKDLDQSKKDLEKSRKQCQKMTTTYDNKEKDLQLKIQDLELKVKTSENDLQVKTQNLETKVKSSEKDLKDSQSKGQRELEEFKQKKQLLQNEIDNLKTQAQLEQKSLKSAATSQKQGMTDEITQLNDRLRSSSQTQGELRARVTDLEEQLKSQKEQTQKYIDISKEEQKNFLREKEKAHASQFQIDKLEQEKKSLQAIEGNSTTQHLIDEIATLTEQCAVHKAKIVKLEVQDSKLRGDIFSSDDKSRALKSQVQEVQNLLQIEQKKNSDLFLDQQNRKALMNSTQIALSEKQSEILIKEQQLELLTGDFNQYVKEVQDRQNTISNMERHFTVLYAKLSEIETLRANIHKEYVFYLECTTRLALECEMEKGKNFQLQANLQCQSWIVERQSLLLNYNSQVMAQQKQAILGLQSSFYEATSQMMLDDVQLIVNIGKAYFEKIHGQVQSLMVQVDSQADAISNEVKLFFSGDIQMQKQAMAYQPKIHPVQTDMLMVDNGNIIIGATPQTQDPTIRAFYDRGDGFLDRILELRKLKESQPQPQINSVDLVSLQKNFSQVTKALPTPKSLKTQLKITSPPKVTSPPLGEKKNKK